MNVVAFAAGFGVARGVVARGPTGVGGAALTFGGALTGGIDCDTEPRAKIGGDHSGGDLTGNGMA